MIKIFVVKGGNLEYGTINDLSSKKNLIWADCINPSTHDLKRISESMQIPFDELKESIDDSERPRAVSNESHECVIFAFPVLERRSVVTSSVSIFIKKNIVLTLRVHESDAFLRIYDLTEEQKKKALCAGPHKFLYTILDHIIDDYFKVMDEVEEKINHIENRVFANPEKKTIREIFSLKKTLIYFHKSLNANREVISSIERELLNSIPKSELKRFRNLHNDLTELIDLESIYMDIMTGALDIYLTSVSNNLNEVMKKITAMGSFILIPTLISGIYGMNFRYMPEILWKYGYFFALGLMALSVVALYTYFKRKKWL